MQNKKDKLYLTPSERIVMRAVWFSNEEMALHGILEICNGALGQEWKPQTVSTFIARLVRKGFLEPRRDGKFVYYSPGVQPEDFLYYEIRNLAEYWNLDEKKLARGVTDAKKRS